MLLLRQAGQITFAILR